MEVLLFMVVHTVQCIILWRMYSIECTYVWCSKMLNIQLPLGIILVNIQNFLDKKRVNYLIQYMHGIQHKTYLKASSIMAKNPLKSFPV